MATIDNILINMESTVDNANIAKQIVLQKLVDEGAIDQETYEIFNREWQIILLKKSWFKRILDWRDNNEYFYHITKLTGDGS